jgi:hypothetical protein
MPPGDDAKTERGCSDDCFFGCGHHLHCNGYNDPFGNRSYCQELADRVEHANIAIKTMQTLIEDIVRDAFPSVRIDWDGVTSPDAFEDHVFEVQPVPTEET